MRFKTIHPEIGQEVSFHYGSGVARGIVEELRTFKGQTRAIISVPDWKQTHSVDIENINGLTRRLV